MANSDSQGDRIRALFRGAIDGVAVIAPFIKIDAMRSLLDVIPLDIPLRCVTRWLPREVAAGVSDPEILNMLEERGNFSLSLVDELHAKLYVAGDRCLAGSANVTRSGLGEGSVGRNIEVLVETTIFDPGIAATLEEISQVERSATRLMAQTARRLADHLSSSTISGTDVRAPWFPGSRRPEYAYGIYANPPGGFVGASDRILLADLAGSNVPPGLEPDEFRTAIRSLISTIPIAESLLESNKDSMLTRAEAQSYLETVAGKEFSTNDRWRAFVNWMAFFFSEKVMKQEITEIALRRAEVLARIR